MWTLATTGKHGGDHSKRDNITLGSERGTSKAGTLVRLKRERDDLYKRVIAHELSANAAAIEAGWRKVKSPLEQLRHWWQKASEAERETFLEEVA